MILWEYKGGTFEEKAQLVGHIESVLSLWFDQESIVSASRDKSIRIWNFHSGKCKYIIKEHAAPVNCCAVENGILVTGSGGKKQLENFIHVFFARSSNQSTFLTNR